jgi:hypothetical protein
VIRRVSGSRIKHFPLGGNGKGGKILQKQVKSDDLLFVF